MMNYAALGQRIRLRRRALKMTQAQLAKAAEVSTSYIGHIERGIKHCTLDTLVALCNAMRISPDALLCDSLSADLNTQTAGLSNESLSLLEDIARVLRKRE